MSHIATPGQTVERRLMLIGGEWVGAVDGQFFSVENPGRRGERIAYVPRAMAEDVDRARPAQQHGREPL